MTKAKAGDTVKVHYTGTLDDGTVFDTSDEGEPIEFTIGAKQMIPGFENGVVGMEVDETKTVKIASDEAYGPHHEERVLEISQDQVPDDMELKLGQVLELAAEDEQRVIVTVTDIGEDTVTLDANHPLAGQDLNFEITLVNIA